MAKVKTPPFFRRVLASGLAALITFLVVRFLLQVTISKEAIIILLMSAFLGSFVSKFIHTQLLADGKW